MAGVKARHPRNIPASYYKPIGQLIVRWGFTELYLQSVIWHVWKIKDPKAARALTWNINADSKVELFGALSPRWIKEPAIQRELHEIHTEAERLRQNRNRLAHGLWGYIPGKRKELLVFYIRSLQRRITPRTFRASVAEVKKWASEIDALNTRLQRFHRALDAPLP